MAAEELLDTIKKHGIIVALEKHSLLRWSLVGVCIGILLYFRLILFAGSLPLFVYWHFSHLNGEQDSRREKGTGKDRDGDETSMNEDEAKSDDYSMGNNTDDDKEDDGLEDMDPFGDKFWDGGDMANNTERSMSPTFPGDDEKTSTSAFLTGDLDDGIAAGASLNSNSNPLANLLGTTHMEKPVAFAAASKPGFSERLEDPHSSFDFDIGLDMFSGSRPPKGGSSKGGSKGKAGGKAGRFQAGEDLGARQADPRQVFVGGLGDLGEDDLRSFFEQVGEIQRVKVLLHPDGQPKGSGFITFRSVDQAQAALQMSSSELEVQGRRLFVRTVKSPPGGKGESNVGSSSGSGSKGFGKSNGMESGFGGKGAPPRTSGPRGSGDDDLGHPRQDGGKRRDVEARGGAFAELDELLSEALEEEDGSLLLSDFDIGAKRILQELMTQDRKSGTQRSVQAIEQVFRQTRNKSRDSVKKWPAYVFTLLQKFDPELSEELRQRDMDRRRERLKGGEAPLDNDVAQAWKFAPPASETKQVLDRWGKPVVL